MSELPASHIFLLMDGTTADAASAPLLAGLTRRMALGEGAAFEEFHAQFAPRLFRYLLVLHRGDEHAASDVLQETLVRVVRHARRFDDEVSFWDWLAKLARCAAADHGRKGHRYLRFLDRLRDLPPVPEPPDDGQIAEAIDAALNQLSENDAELLRAKYYAGLSQRELAAQFAISEEAIESRLRRARATLRTSAFQILRERTP